MKKNYWIIIIAGVIVMAAAVTTTAYFRNSKKSNPSPTPTISNSNPASSSPTTSESTGTVNQVKIFLIAPDDNGKNGLAVGCGDSAVFVTREIAPTKAPLKASIEELLKIKEQNYGQSGLVNSLYQSNLTFDSANITDGLAIVKLSGSLVIGGVCDSPRIRAQLEQTALQFSTINSVEFFINGKKLDDILSQK